MYGTKNVVEYVWNEPTSFGQGTQVRSVLEAVIAAMP